MSSEGQTIREAFQYLEGYDVGGWPGHLRSEEVMERIEAALAALEARLAEAERAIDAARRELGRASDVRANRTTIIGNTDLILQRLPSESGTA